MARSYFLYKKNAEKQYDSSYRFCPSECKKGFNYDRREFCESCPVKKTDETFKNKTLEVWEKVLGLHNFRFENVLSRFYDAMRFSERPPEKLTVKTAQIVGIYISERNFHEDKKDK